MTRAVVCGSVFVCALAAQQGFDAITLRANKSGDRNSEIALNINGSGASVTITNESLTRVLARAYGVKEYQLEGPDWLKTDRYDLTATTGSHVTQEEAWQRLQGVLTARYGLTLHREVRNVLVYELVAAPRGANLQAAKPGRQNGTWAEGGTELRGQNENMEHFAEVLSRQMDRPVLNKTGLAGGFDFSLSNSTAEAIEEQLGLRLQLVTVPVEILVIDHVEKASVKNE